MSNQVGTRQKERFAVEYTVFSPGRLVCADETAPQRFKDWLKKKCGVGPFRIERAPYVNDPRKNDGHPQKLTLVADSGAPVEISGKHFTFY